MLRSDAQKDRIEESLDGTFSNINTITIEVISQIEKDLQAYDLVSMVFLLYDIPDTALQRLIVYQRVSADNCETNLNLLYDWAQHAQAQPTWRYELIEALCICQLYRVIRKLGFKVSSIKNYYQPDNLKVTFHVNPMKKALYKLCENMTSDNQSKLQNTLKTYDIDTSEYKTNELVILELMCKKFISIGGYKDKQYSKQDCHIEKLAKILENIAGLRKFANELREIQKTLNAEPKFNRSVSSSKVETSDSKEEINDDDDDVDYNDDFKDIFTANAFNDIFKSLAELNIEDTTIKHLKSDTKKYGEDTYPIKNAKRVGVCYIINQEDFHPSKESIEGNISTTLGRRLGSNRDRFVLEKTMTSFNFEVITHQNLDHNKMLELLKNIINYRVHHDDSMFMLCILSHGVRGQVYAADSVKVKVDDIKNVLDDVFESRNLEIPKIMIIQACQVSSEEPVNMPRIVSDAPLRKSHFLIYWATAPELEAFRDEKQGSIFIQMLCCVIKKYAKQEHLFDIFTKVNNCVAEICTKIDRAQVPLFESTLRKKLYLHVPD